MALVDKVENIITGASIHNEVNSQNSEMKDLSFCTSSSIFRQQNVNTFSSFTT
jgi:hypothetical protein